jgi:hypothetical protein
MKLKRVYHPYDTWEEIKFNMWGEVDDKAEWLQKAIAFTSDHKQYGHYMLRVTREWPISCENALTDININQMAWIGHAACALAMQCPEDIIRTAWGYLTDEQRLLANKEAERAIQKWSIRYAESKGLHKDMGGSLLPYRDTGRSAKKANEVRPRPVI